MACINCTPIFNPASLLIENANDCKKCTKVIDYIECNSSLAYLVYSIDIQEKFKKIAPIFNGSQLLMFNARFLDEGYSEGEILSDIIDSLNIKNTTYENKNEIENVCNIIMGHIIDRIKDLIFDNPKGYLVSLLTILEYSIHLTFMTVGWLNDEENKINIEEITDDVGKLIIRSLKFQRDNNYFGQFEQIYKDWEGTLSLDKLALQYGIEVVSYLSKNRESSNKEISQIKFKKLFVTIRAMYELLLTRDEASKNKRLQIDKEGNISSKKVDNYKEFSKLYVDSLIGRKKSAFDLKVKGKFNRVCKKYIGISLDDINIIIDNLMKCYCNSDDFLIGTKEYFQELIKNLSGCSDEDAKLFMYNFLSNGNDTFIFATNTSLRDNRPLRKCLITVDDDIIACPISVLKFSLIGFYNDITHATLPESLFQKELFKIVDKNVNEKFEMDVVKHLQKNLHGVYIKGDIKENTLPDITYGKRFVHFTGQIDIIMMYEKKLFVIECKNPDLKYTEKAMMSEVNRFREKGDFQKKLNTKVKEVYDNWDSVVKFLGVEENVEKHTPISFFVINTFSMAVLEKDLPNKVIPFSNLIEWINQQI